MGDWILFGVGRLLLPVPGLAWRALVAAAARKTRAGLAFMTGDHRRVRDFAVLELARAGKPVTPQRIAEATGLGVERVREIVAELERRLTFLFRSRGDAVTWAYPVTVDETPHRAVFGTGEEAYSP